MKRALSRARGARPTLAMAVLFLLLGGCALLSAGGGPPVRLFTPHPKTSFAPDLPKVDWQLAIDPPIAPASLDTVRIAVQKTPLELDYYANAAWADRVPSMVQTLLAASFENSGKIVGVGRMSATIRADFTLRTDIRDFEVQGDAAHPAARVRIVSKLIKMPEREIVADDTCDYDQPAAAGTLDAIVEAYNDVLGRCMRRIVEWTLRTGDRVKAAK